MENGRLLLFSPLFEKLLDMKRISDRGDQLESIMVNDWAGQTGKIEGMPKTALSR
jgi:hypothetical protein